MKPFDTVEDRPDVLLATAPGLLSPYLTYHYSEEAIATWRHHFQATAPYHPEALLMRDQPRLLLAS